MIRLLLAVVAISFLASPRMMAALDPELSDAFNGQAAPAITATSLAGDPVSLAGDQGHVTLVVFFATWCPPCKKQITELQKLQASRPDLRIIGLVSDNLFPPADPEEKITAAARSLAETKKLAWPLVLAADQLGKDYHFKGIPTTVVVDPKGVIQKVVYGFNEASVFDPIVTAAGSAPASDKPTDTKQDTTGR